MTGVAKVITSEQLLTALRQCPINNLQGQGPAHLFLDSLQMKCYIHKTFQPKHFFQYEHSSFRVRRCDQYLSSCLLSTMAFVCLTEKSIHIPKLPHRYPIQVLCWTSLEIADTDCKGPHIEEGPICIDTNEHIHFEKVVPSLVYS
jgi:hypothetical protein